MGGSQFLPSRISDFQRNSDCCVPLNLWFSKWEYLLCYRISDLHVRAYIGEESRKLGIFSSQVSRSRPYVSSEILAFMSDAIR